MKKSIVWVLLFSLLYASNVYASSSDYSIGVENNLSIGGINISLAEYEYNNGRLVPCETANNVLPGQEVSHVVRVTNELSKAWIRAKVEYINDSGLTELNDNMLNINMGWVKSGEYYYYKHGVESKGYVDLFDRVVIPYEWDESHMSKDFGIVVTVEAVQFSNFTPNFGSNDPWFGTLIETWSNNMDNRVVSSNTSNFQIIFQNGSEGFIRLGDDFFSNWGELMPGDVVTDSIEIGNNYSSDVTIYFKTETVSSSDLLNKIRLTISQNGTILYSGSLNASELNSGISLGTFRRGEASRFLDYELRVPSDLTNIHALSSTKVKWVFYTSITTGSSGSEGGGTETPKEPVQPTKPVEPKVVETKEMGFGSGSSSSDEVLELSSINDGETAFSRWISSLPKTGDYSNGYLYLVILGVSAFGLVVLLVAKRKEANSNEEE